MLIRCVTHEAAWPLDAQVLSIPASTCGDITLYLPWSLLAESAWGFFPLCLGTSPSRALPGTPCWPLTDFCCLDGPRAHYGSPTIPVTVVSLGFASSLGSPVFNPNTKVRCTCSDHITSLLQTPFPEEKPKFLKLPTRPSTSRLPVTPQPTLVSSFPLQSHSAVPLASQAHAHPGIFVLDLPAWHTLPPASNLWSNVTTSVSPSLPTLLGTETSTPP